MSTEYAIGSIIGSLIGRGMLEGDQRKQQKEYTDAIRNIVGTMQEKQDLNQPNAIPQKAVYDVANSAKYAPAIDAAYPDDPEIKARQQFQDSVERLVDYKRQKELYASDQSTYPGYSNGISAKEDELNNALAQTAQKYKFDLNPTISADGLQRALDAYKAETASQSAAWANKQNPTSVQGQQPQPINFSDLNSDINARQGVLEQRRKELNDPISSLVNVQSQLIDKGYKPDTVDAAMRFYTNAVIQDKATQDEQTKKQALAAVVKTLYTTKDPDARNTALIAYDLINGGKNAPEYYKSGLPEYSIHDTDYGNSVGSVLLDKKSGIKGVTVAPKGNSPDKVLDSNTTLAKARMDNETTIAKAQIAGNYDLQKAGINYQRAIDVAKLSREGKLDPVDKAIVDTVSEALTDPDKWSALNKTEQGQQYLQRYRKLAGNGSGKISDADYDKMYNYYVNSGLSPEEAHKKIQKAFW